MKTLPQILFKPVVLALTTALGLVAALVSDGAGDVLAWLSLAAVCGVGIRHALKRPRTSYTDQR